VKQILTSDEATEILERVALSEAKRKLLREYMLGRAPLDTSSIPSIKRRPAGTVAPLSLMQEQVWSRAIRLRAVPSFYNESVTIHRNGDLDLEVLERSLTEIVRRHEIWRTTIHVIEGEPLQIIHPVPSRVTVSYVDMSRGPESTRRARVIRLASEHARAPFDLQQGPLVRALLVTLDHRTHKLFLTMHQSVVDGVSVYRILPFELATLYEAFSAREPSPLPDLALQYADFAYWERQQLHDPIWARQIGYWRERLADFPSCQWLGARSAPFEGSHGTTHGFTLPRNLYLDLKDLCLREGVTLFMALLAGFTLILSKNMEQKDIAVGTVAPAGRKHPEVQALLGYFLNPVALRLNLSGNPSVRELLHQCREITLGALANDDVPLESLTKQLDTEMNLSSGCVLPMAITLAPPLFELNGGWHQTPMDVDSGWAKWGCYLELSERPEGLLGRVQYSTDLFTSATIRGLLQAFTNVLQRLVTKPDGHISDLLPFESLAFDKPNWDRQHLPVSRDIG
jgi:surfactin family lipopeptide synthetase A